LPFRSVVHEDPHFSIASSHAGTTARNIFTRCCRQEPRRQDYDRLDLTRQRKFRTIGRGKSESEVDEAAIALVELSVLVYDDIGTIGKTAAKLPIPAWDCLERKETATRTWKPSAKSVNRCQTSAEIGVRLA
jgi:hypothetical protein